MKHIYGSNIRSVSDPQVAQAAIVFYEELIAGRAVKPAAESAERAAIAREPDADAR